MEKTYYYFSTSDINFLKLFFAIIPIDKRVVVHRIKSHIIIAEILNKNLSKKYSDR